jgi:hypothetical protein
VLIESDESDQMDPRRLKVLQSLQRVFEDEYGIEFLLRLRIQARACVLGKRRKMRSVDQIAAPSGSQILWRRNQPIAIGSVLRQSRLQ